MAVTIKDIAQRAGVSHTTVSRALRNHPAIAPDTTIRIQKLAEELGYVPNFVARDLKNARSTVLGVIIRRIVDPFFSEVLDGIERVATAAGYGLFLASTNQDPQKEKAVIRLMNEHRVAGVIICSTASAEEYREQLLQFSVPSVLVNSQSPGDLDYSVYNDDVYGARQMVRHLIDLGHTRIAYLGNVLAGRATADRLSGYREEMAAAGLSIPAAYIVNGHNGQADGGALAAQKLIALKPRPTAIVCYNDMSAVGAMKTLLEAGIRIPEDCSVTGFDNIDITPYVHPSLTTLDQPKYELGKTAADMILKLQKTKDQAGVIPPDKRIIILRGTLKARGSTAAPPADLPPAS